MKGKHMDKGQKIGRLAMRVEGEFWVGYYALPNTMEGAIALGSIRMWADAHAKGTFMQLMWTLVADTLEKETGQRPEHYGIETAPEHERSKQ